MSSKSDFKILAIDDEKDILLLLKYNLEKEGYTVKTSDSGVEALKIVEIFSPDLILLDIMMPKLDGIETCIKLRSIESLLNVYIMKQFEPLVVLAIIILVVVQPHALAQLNTTILGKIVLLSGLIMATLYKPYIGLLVLLLIICFLLNFFSIQKSCSLLKGFVKALLSLHLFLPQFF